MKCETCENCFYCGDGESVCEVIEKIVIEDFGCPTRNYLGCINKRKQGKRKKKKN